MEEVSSSKNLIVDEFHCLGGWHFSALFWKTFILVLRYYKHDVWNDVSSFNIIIALVVVANSLHTGQDAENWTNFSAVTWS
jgi:hypothetical protein